VLYNILIEFVVPMKLVGLISQLNSNLLAYVKRGLIKSLHKIAFTICQDLHNEISSLRCNLQFNGYPQGFIDLAINYEAAV
jgi:hypothetical protein